MQFQSSSNNDNSSMIKKKDFIIKSNEKFFPEPKLKASGLHSNYYYYIF